MNPDWWLGVDTPCWLPNWLAETDASALWVASCAIDVSCKSSDALSFCSSVAFSAACVAAWTATLLASSCSATTWNPFDTYWVTILCRISLQQQMTFRRLWTLHRNAQKNWPVQMLARLSLGQPLAEYKPASWPSGLLVALLVRPVKQLWPKPDNLATA